LTVYLFERKPQHTNVNMSNKYIGSSDVQSTSGFGNIQYTLEEREFLQRELEQKLGQEDITNRPGPGGQLVHYIETWRAIELANKIFGFNGWSSSIMEINQDYVDQVEATGRFNAGVSAIVRISLKDGSFHEDIGYGVSDNQKHKGAAIEQAKKKAVSDGLKRALRNFGNALGLTVYDKEHIAKIKRASRNTLTKNAQPLTPRPVNPFYMPNGSTATQQTQVSVQQDEPNSNGSTQSLLGALEGTNIKEEHTEAKVEIHQPPQRAPPPSINKNTSPPQPPRPNRPPVLPPNGASAGRVVRVPPRLPQKPPLQPIKRPNSHEENGREQVDEAEQESKRMKLSNDQ
jgi:DNA repair and recombination protein RAD52